MSATAGELVGGSRCPDPIFVIGAPRSGVRLLAAVLDRHAALASGPELPFLVAMARQWRSIESTLSANHDRNYGVTPSAVREAFRSTMLKPFELYLAAVHKARFVHHSFAGMLSIAEFGALFPNAHFIMMVRDPRDIAASLARCDWRNPRDGSPLPYTRDPAAAARMWLDFIRIAMRDIAPMLEGRRALLIRYEDLCHDPKHGLERIAQFVNVAPLQGIVQAESASRIVRSLDNPHPSLREGPLDQTSIGRWRASLPAADLGAVEAMTHALRMQFDYR